jgi:EF hand
MKTGIAQLLLLAIIASLLVNCGGGSSGSIDESSDDPIIEDTVDPDDPAARFSGGKPFYYAWYVAFGRAVNLSGQDIHGAGAVRFDTKHEGGPAGEGGERYRNFVRLVRDAGPVKSQPEVETDSTPEPPEDEGDPGERPDGGDRGSRGRPDRGEGSPGGRQGEGPPSGDDIIKRLDRNGDGKISKTEFDGPSEHFSHLDGDGDGYITCEEAAKAPPPRRGR